VYIEEKLAESTAANAALTSQLENISPQLSSLEVALSNSRHKLKEEQSLRRLAEQAQDDADQKIRTLEQTILSLREECDDVHEELAFKESELEETRLELEVEKQQLQNELSLVRQALAVAVKHDNSGGSTEDTMDSSAEMGGNVIRGVGTDRAVDMTDQTQTDETNTVTTDVDKTTPVLTVTPTTTVEGYAKHLEDELELVTEQLIETEKLLSATQEDLLRKENQFRIMHEQLTTYETQEKQYQQLQTDHDEVITDRTRLQEHLTTVQDELALCKEEIQLQTEAITALEQDYQTTLRTLEEERNQHKSIVDDLHVQIRELEISTKASMNEASLIGVAVQDANKQNETMMEQVAALESALENAKNDYQKCLEELDLVNARFDEARIEAEQAGRDDAMEEMRNVMRSDAEHEIRKVREDLEQLSIENKLLQQKVDEAEIKLAAVKDHDNETVSNGGSTIATSLNMDSVIQELQKQLQSSKDDIAKKEEEIVTFTSDMTTRLQKAEDMVLHLEGELHAAKRQLAEAEAHLIVLRNEKERKDHMIPESPTRKSIKNVIDVQSLLFTDDNTNDVVQQRGRSAADTSILSEPATPIDTKRPRSSSPSSVMRLELRLAEEVKKNVNLEKEYNELHDQKRMGEVRIKRLEEDIKVLQKQLFATTSGSNDAVTVTTQMSRLSSLGNTERGMDLMSNDEIAGKRLEQIIDSRDVKLLSEELKLMEKKCNSQREYNAQLLSKMLHLQGNIQVYCRIRPMTIQEIQHGSRCVVEPLSDTEVGCYDLRTNKWKSFVFDRVWGPDQSQTSVFQDVEPLALSVVDGFNACIFAYVLSIQ
jgi:chromosome segregation ATPase